MTGLTVPILSSREESLNKYFILTPHAKSDAKGCKKNETDATEQVFPIWHCLVPAIVMPFWLFIVACLVLWAFPTRAHLRHYCLSQPAVWNRCSNICHCLDHLAMGGMPPLRVGREQLCTVCSCIFRALSSLHKIYAAMKLKKASAISTFSPVSCGKLVKVPITVTVQLQLVQCA